MIEEGKCYDTEIKDDDTDKTELYFLYVNYKYHYYDQVVVNCDIFDEKGNLYINQNIPTENISNYKLLSFEDCENIFKKDMFNRYFDSFDY